MGIAAMLVTIFTSEAQTARGAEPGRLAAFTARQRLRDEVCIAVADGHISRAERYAILTRAKAVLKPEEYEGLKRTMERLSPSEPARMQRSTNTAPNAAPGSVERQALPLAGPSPEPTIPSGAILPDRMASTDDAR
jgi:hypothetical protein